MLETESPASPKQAEPNQGLKGLIHLDGFKKLWIGQVFSQLADKFYIVLMVFLITQNWVIKSPQSNGELADIAAAIRMQIETPGQMITLLATGIFVANTIPAIAMGSIAGVWADRWPKRSVMVASNAVRAFLVLFTPLCLIPGPLFLGITWGYWALILMTFFESILTNFFAPAEQAAIPMLVPKGNLLAANSVYQATSMGATIVGFALGEPILQLLHKAFLPMGFTGGEFLLLPFCYGMAALSINSMKLKEQIKLTNKQTTVLQEIIDGLKVVQDRPKVRSGIVHLVLLYSLLAALYVLAISLASSIEGLGPARFGTLLAMSGIGMAGSAVLIAQVGHWFSRRRLTATGLGIITFSLIMLTQAEGSQILTLVFCTSLGLGAALVAIPAQTTIQEETPVDQRGKVFGLQNSLINIALSLPLALAGALVSLFGLLPLLWLLAVIALIAALLEHPWQRC
ncbi:MFS transporter [Prochlorococcus sp. MIT 1300]|uniref:MFS transporter n=1 Tax=Prochlorococcus sp. MIT 1300 TaxID=3096218 RepID=UPI002A760546|nr:MFS transporter [Prochlorococcus sp. MIT 1300]